MRGSCAAPRPLTLRELSVFVTWHEVSSNAVRHNDCSIHGHGSQTCAYCYLSAHSYDIADIAGTLTNAIGGDMRG
jgi:hypothetical protein